LNSCHHLHYASIPPLHAINSILDTPHAKNQPSYRFTTANLIAKQQVKLKSPIKDVNEYLNEIFACFNSTHTLFSPGLRLVNCFSSRITFHSLVSFSNENTYKHIQNLRYVFNQLQNSSHSVTIITDSSIKKSNIALVIAYIWTNNSVKDQLYLQTMNVILIEAKLISIYLGLITSSHLLICDWCFRILKGSKIQSLDSNKRCC